MAKAELEKKENINQDINEEQEELNSILERVESILSK